MPSESGDKENNRGNLASVIMRVVDSLTERFTSGKNEKRNSLILILLTALLLTFFIIPSQQLFPTRYNAGDIAGSDIRATQDYLLEDRPLTEKKRAEAEAVAPYVYTHNADLPLELKERMEKALEFLRLNREADSSELVEEVSASLGVRLTPAELRSFGRIRSERALLADVDRLLGQLYLKRVVSDRKAFDRDLEHGILLINNETKQEIAGGDYSSYIGIEEARRLLLNERLTLGADSRDLEPIRRVLSRMIEPNVTFDRQLSEQKKREARELARPVLFKLKRGEMVVRVGEKITDEQAAKLEKMFEGRKGTNLFFAGFGIFGLVLITFFFPYRFARKNIRKFNPSGKDLLLICLITLINFGVLKIAYVVSSAMGGPFPSIDTSDYFYLLPFAVCPILVRIILNSEISIVYTAITAPLLGIMFSSSLPVVIYALLGGIVGAHGARQCMARGTIFTAGMKLSAVNLALALSFQIYHGNFLTMQTLFCAIFAMTGGIINAVIVTGTIPVVETLFHYTTDIRLLELANLNSPILRELMVRAPGTYHHSVIVGNLVEAAAEAINANPLLARVAAYHHDIGKIAKPGYFIENLPEGENRHDRLAPSMSALILISHIREGVELAREHRLGVAITDIIKQSHGTALISFFYNKARLQAAAEGKLIDEREFRYPGPKPQTREAGLVMLADCVEAASRTLADPTPARIQGMVQKIINNIFIDGQLDECELTLKNLHEIAKSFNQILTGIYHHRIDYPEPAFKEKTNGGKKHLESSGVESTKEGPGQGEDPETGGSEDLRRLGISR